MTNTLRIVMAQINLLVGDVNGNAAKVKAAITRARDELGAQLVMFPELTLTGYPPEDLLFHSSFRREISAALADVCAHAQGIAVLIGYPQYADHVIYNVASLLRDGGIIATYRKQCLPNYSVFDEKRYFTPGEGPTLVNTGGVPMALTVCEDIWHRQPAAQAAAAGAQLILNINASPYEIGKQQQRERMLAARARECGLPIIYVNHVCGQDELVFDGGSLAMDAQGRVIMRAPSFEEGLYAVEFKLDNGCLQPLPGAVHVDGSEEESVYRGIVLGVGDYVRKNHFKGAVVGLSGGIDSALTLAIAVDALGRENVTAVMMPSRYTSELSREAAESQARALGVPYHLVSIEPVFAAFLESLSKPLKGGTGGVIEQNLQARCRGVLLMAISNQSGRLVLTTGNKSELAVGYATLYGDMAGGFAPLKDVTKTLVYRLARYRNALSPAIPQVVIERAPSAELAPGQKDSDSLPPYEILDPILTAYVEDDRTVAEIVAMGYAEATVKRVVGMIQQAEYKRRQGPPGVRVSRRAFSRDRRYPITSGYR